VCEDRPVASSRPQEITVAHTIIVGYDGRAGGRAALELALRSADVRADAEIVVVTADSVGDSHQPAVRAVEAALLEAAEERLASARERAGDRAGVSFEVVRASSPAAALHRRAEELGAALIVVGESHLGVLGRIAAGSITEQVLHAAPCAVAVAPHGYAPVAEGAPRIGAAYSRSAEAGLAIDAAVEAARLTGGTLRLIHVIGTELLWYFGAVGSQTLQEVRDGFVAEMRERAEAIDGVEVEVEVVEGDAAIELGRAGEHLDLLVLGSRGYGPVRRVLLGSVSAKAVRHVRCPMLIVPRGTGE
jgi:nucleotide-binding universal stress UspA family protein